MSFRIIWRKFATIANLATNQELTLLENVKASSGSDVDDVDGLWPEMGEAFVPSETYSLCRVLFKVYENPCLQLYFAD